jgi:hypothetical protein
MGDAVVKCRPEDLACVGEVGVVAKVVPKAHGDGGK